MRLTDGTLTSMRISLPPSFPADRPALSITSPVRHPWVDGIGRLSFPLLDRWGAPTVRLAAVVADAFKGLGGTPAPLPSRAQAPGGGATTSPMRPQQYGQQGAAHPAPSPQSSSGQLSASGSGLVGAGSRPAAGLKVPLPPPVPNSFPEVEEMSEEHLAGVLADAAAYKRLVDAVAERIGLFKVSAAGLVGVNANWLRCRPAAVNGLRVPPFCPPALRAGGGCLDGFQPRAGCRQSVSG
jgi:ESCRT-I complex subunit VPS37